MRGRFTRAVLKVVESGARSWSVRSVGGLDIGLHPQRGSNTKTLR
jgi:hypothetical protein